MKFEDTDIIGCKLIFPEKKVDDRGYFARLYCLDEFKVNKLNTEWCQINSAYNKGKGTLRGMHLQLPPFAETKIIRCTKGSVFDVLLDVRENSETYGKWTSFQLSGSNSFSLYVPEGVAHGYQTLEDDTELSYMHSVSFNSEFSTGFSAFDPNLEINWPLKVSKISSKDLSWKNLK